LPEANAEIVEAVEWHEGQKKGLGRQFLSQVRSAVANLRRTPLHYQVVDEQVRRVLLHRFQYGVFYEIHGGDVVVIACLHTSRDPHEWRRRIRLV
jgi:plasmid stabilization system protein ParE